MAETEDFQVIWDFLLANGIKLPDPTVTITFHNGSSYTVEVPQELVSDSSDS